MLQVLTRSRTAVSPIGLDVGNRGVRTAQLVRTRNGWAVTGLARSSSRAGAEPDAARQAEQVRSCVGRGAFRGRAVVAALAPTHIEHHALDLPAALLEGGEQASQAVRHEIEQLMTLPEGEVETRHWRLPQTTVPAPNALGVAARRDQVRALTELCESAGLRCQAVDSPAAALCRLGTVLHPVRENEVWGLLDLGEEQTRIVVCVDETPMIVRPLAAGGDTWTQLIASALEVSPQSAEVHKREHGIALPGSGSAPAGGGPAPGSELAHMLLGALRAELNQLASGLKLSYEYALSCYPTREAGDLILVGSGAGLKNLPEFLSATLGILVRRASDLLQEAEARLNFGASQRDALQEYALAVGLALRD